MKKVICAKCTFGEGMPGAKCGWCSAAIVPWKNSPTQSKLVFADFKLHPVNFLKLAHQDYYCEFRSADNKFKVCYEKPAIYEVEGTLSQAIFLCEKHFNSLTIEDGHQALFKCTFKVSAFDQAGHLRTYTHRRLGEIYVFNHGGMANEGYGWYACLKTHWSGGEASEAEFHIDPEAALAALISKHDK